MTQQSYWMVPKNLSTKHYMNLNSMQNFQVLKLISLKHKTFDTNLVKMLALNFSDKLSNIQTKINYWNRRNLIPLGKITAVKSLLLS